MRGFFEAAFEGIVIHDHGTILDANEAAAQITGYTVEEMKALTAADLAAPESRELIAARVHAHDDSAYEAIGLRKDGTKFTAEIRAKTIPFRGKPVRVTVVRDITERKRVEEARERAEAALKRANAELEYRVASRTEELQQKNDELERKQRFLEQMLNAHERNRQLVAYEIHDTFLQDVIAAQMFIEGQQNSVADEHEAVWRDLESARKLLRKAIDEARRMIGGLRPPIIDEQGVVAAIDYLISELKARGIQIDFRHKLERERLPALLEGTLFRIVQEALSNIERHSKADHGTVELIQTDGVARITIADQGIGFDPAAVADGHFGLQGIRERTRLMGGVVEIRSAPGAGTRIAVEVPVLTE